MGESLEVNHEEVQEPYVVTSGHGLRRGRGRPPTLIMPEPILDTPENIARALLTAPPNKDWDYLKPVSPARRGPDDEECAAEQGLDRAADRRAADHNHAPPAAAAATRAAVSEPPPAPLVPPMPRAVPDPGHGVGTDADPRTAVPHCSKHWREVRTEVSERVNLTATSWVVADEEGGWGSEATPDTVIRPSPLKVAPEGPPQGPPRGLVAGVPGHRDNVGKPIAHARGVETEDETDHVHAIHAIHSTGRPPLPDRWLKPNIQGQSGVHSNNVGL